MIDRERDMSEVQLVPLQTELMCDLLASRADTSTSSSGDSALGTCEEDRFTPDNGEQVRSAAGRGLENL